MIDPTTAQLRAKAEQLLGSFKSNSGVWHLEQQFVVAQLIRELLSALPSAEQDAVFDAGYAKGYADGLDESAGDPRVERIEAGFKAIQSATNGEFSREDMMVLDALQAARDYAVRLARREQHIKQLIDEASRASLSSASPQDALPSTPQPQEKEEATRVDDLHRESTGATTAGSNEVPPATYQNRVRAWVLECFGETIANDMTERGFRFLEEALELSQSIGCTKEQAAALVEYVYGRIVGVPEQEVGGVMVTLAALTSAAGIDLQAAAERELARVNSPEVIAKIRRKQAAKRGVVSHAAQAALPGEWAGGDVTTPALRSTQGQAWQPMPDAPKDGRLLLLWWPYWRANAPVVGWWQVNGGWQCYEMLESESEPPMAWQPLPAPPLPESQG